MIKRSGYSTIETLIILPLFAIFLAIIIYLYRMNATYLIFNQAVKETNDLILYKVTDFTTFTKENCEDLLKEYFSLIDLEQSNLTYTCTLDIDTILVEAEYMMSPTGSFVMSNTFKAHNYITGLEVLK